MMPKETGLAYAARLRKREKAPPVLLLTARGEAEHRIEGLEAGAAARGRRRRLPSQALHPARAGAAHGEHPRPHRTAAPRSFRFGRYRFEPAAGRLLHQDEPIYLTSGETDCLRILAEHAGEPVSREKIAELSGNVSNERSVDVQINRLRKKIEPNPGKPVYIQTVRHAGYVLHAEAAS